jgi:hypothetical protein
VDRRDEDVAAARHFVGIRGEARLVPNPIRREREIVEEREENEQEKKGDLYRAFDPIHAHIENKAALSITERPAGQRLSRNPAQAS